MNWQFHAPMMASRHYRPEPMTYAEGRCADHRLKYLLYFLDVRGKNVLELGPLEGHFTLMLAKLGAKFVTGLEGRQINVDKCNVMIARHHMDAECRKADVEQMTGKIGDFDLVFHAGLLYHLGNPAENLAWCREQAPELFLSTHYWDRKSPHEFKPATIEHKGKFYEGVGGGEVTTAPTQAIGPKSFWASEESLLAMLADVGYTQIDVLGKDIQNDLPQITLMAS